MSSSADSRQQAGPPCCQSFLQMWPWRVIVISSRHGMQTRWFLMPGCPCQGFGKVRDSRELTTYIEEREIGRAAHQTRQQVLLDETEYGFKRCTLLGLPQAAVASRLAHPSLQEHVFTLCKGTECLVRFQAGGASRVVVAERPHGAAGNHPIACKFIMLQ